MRQLYYLFLTKILGHGPLYSKFKSGLYKWGKATDTGFRDRECLVTGLVGVYPLDSTKRQRIKERLHMLIYGVAPSGVETLTNKLAVYNDDPNTKFKDILYVLKEAGV